MAESMAAVACGSLRSLCTQIVLYYPHLTEKGFRILPFEIIQAILHASVNTQSITLLQHVLKFWPFRVVVIGGVPSILRNEDEKFVARAVAEYISGRDETDTVQVIDIRERKLGFQGSTELCKAVIAANKDSNFTEGSNGICPNVVTSVSDASLDNVKPVLTVYADICVNYSNPDTVLKALKTENRVAQLCVSAFSAVELGDDRLSGFLKVLNADHLTVLDFSYNGLAYYDNVSVDLSTIFQEMKKFTKLRALSLAYNDFEESHLRDLCEVVETLPCLVSLDLSGNYVGGSIELLLNSIRVPLKCLRLGHGRIGNAGILSIACSKHSSQLTELDVSFNCLTSECLHNLLSILEASKNTLQRLNVEGNGICASLVVNKQFLDLLSLCAFWTGF